ncbi:hypothetical protein QR680_002807 [Steinernema hermaphroditum]|uniref:WAPL domain-containing protein n=1 Tax=Steinernema hermaphroditum TaxID=289476 RepID=A0AA39H453_9BILA|nr:hypothetical protein QR680_002807 [Steinernema hermaphroditum]
MSKTYGKAKDKASSLFDQAFKRKPKSTFSTEATESVTADSDAAVSRISPPSPSKTASISQPSTSVFDFDDDDNSTPGSSFPGPSKQKRSVSQTMEVDDLQEEEPLQKMLKNANITAGPKRPLEDDPNHATQSGFKKLKNVDGLAITSSDGPTNPATTKSKFFTRKNRPPAVYHHEWTDDCRGPKDKPTYSVNVTRTSRENTSPEKEDCPPKLVVLQGRGKVRFTVPVMPTRPIQKIRNVRDPAQCLQSGEHDDFKQTLDYFMGTLMDRKNSSKIHALCMLQVARKCASSSGFRQFIKSRNSFNHIMTILSYERNYAELNLCLAGYMFMMTREKGLMPLDDKTVRAVASLLKAAPANMPNDYEKYRTKLWEAIEECHSAPLNKEYDFELRNQSQLTPEFLMLDSLAAMASWKVDQSGRSTFPKEELLAHGCVQFITDKMDGLVQEITGNEISDADRLTYIIAFLNRAFRIVEFATEFHKRNQAFMLSHRAGLLIQVCANFFKFCLNFFTSADYSSPQYQDCHVLNCLEACCRALINLSHGSELCAGRLGADDEYLHTAVYLFVYVLPKFASKSYDLRVMMCSLLINLVERCEDNRITVSKLKLKFFIDGKEKEYNCLEGFARLFLYHESSARTIDEDLDRDLVDAEQSDEDEEENNKADGRLKRPHEMTEGEMLKTVQDAMNKASLHMEDSVCASYVALLVGCLLQRDKDSAEVVRKVLPDRSFTPMIEQLSRFVEFMKEASKGSDSSSLLKIIGVLEEFNTH